MKELKQWPPDSGDGAETGAKSELSGRPLEGLELPQGVEEWVSTGVQEGRRLSAATRPRDADRPPPFNDRPADSHTPTAI